MSAFLSIITVTRNNKQGLAETAESIAVQDNQSYEWIIVDGNSTDGSIAYIQDIRGQYPRVHIISEDDKGIYDAMNKGLNKASGEYVIFMNAGDQFASHDVIARMADCTKTLDGVPDLIYGDSLEQISQANRRCFYKKARHHRTIPFGMFTHHQAMAYKRILCSSMRYDQNYAIAADYKFTLLFCENVRNIQYLKHPICIFEAGGISQRRTKQGRREQFLIRKETQRVNPVTNLFIYTGQSIMMFFRKTMPWLYHLLKKRR
ncbi:MAG: glycosyltransferase family 2 protein [Alphaproteobacteria bacterium]|jgi:putative colanic acid biosynthesis glycosyltransferase|nr:glycosyltransferase family 2 protein [Alphaproteobacteria bacterium]MDP7222157.1 glycosyltransferase family 2 protein [Alphaproteobacteria bacterium]